MGPVNTGTPTCKDDLLLIANYPPERQAIAHSNCKKARVH